MQDNDTFFTDFLHQGFPYTSIFSAYFLHMVALSCALKLRINFILKAMMIMMSMTSTPVLLLE